MTVTTDITIEGEQYRLYLTTAGSQFYAEYHTKLCRVEKFLGIPFMTREREVGSEFIRSERDVEEEVRSVIMSEITEEDHERELLDEALDSILSETEEVERKL